MIGSAMLGESVWCADNAKMAVAGDDAEEMAENYARRCLAFGIVDQIHFDRGLTVDVTIDGVESTHLIDLHIPPMECRVRKPLGVK